jgi:hypothetical protein
MASDIQDGGRNSKEDDIKIFNDFTFLAIFDHESRPHFAKLIKNDGSIQNGGSKSDFLAQLREFPILFLKKLHSLIPRETQILWIKAILIFLKKKK